MKLVSVLVLLMAAQSANAELFPGVRERNMRNQVTLVSQAIVNRQASNQPIPSYVLPYARCVASLRVVKAGFIWGGEGSTGLITCRTPQGWSAPSFFNVGGVTFGLQIGVQFLESILVFTSDYSRQVLYGPSVKLGGDLSFAAGPVGAGTGAGFTPRTHVLTYDYSVGLYAGATVSGLVLTHAPLRNQAAYGASVIPAQILAAPGQTYTPAILRPFYDTVNAYLP